MFSLHINLNDKISSYTVNFQFLVYQTCVCSFVVKIRLRDSLKQGGEEALKIRVTDVESRAPPLVPSYRSEQSNTTKLSSVSPSVRQDPGPNAVPEVIFHS